MPTAADGFAGNPRKRIKNSETKEVGNKKLSISDSRLLVTLVRCSLVASHFTVEIYRHDLRFT